MSRTDDLRDFARFYFSSPVYWGPGALACVGIVLSVLALRGVGR